MTTKAEIDAMKFALAQRARMKTGGVVHMEDGGFLDQLKSQIKSEYESLKKPGAVTDIINRGVVAPVMGAATDIPQMALEGADWLQSKIPGLRKTASVMDTQNPIPQRQDPAMGYVPKFPLATDEPYGGTAHAQRLMREADMTSSTERPLMEAVAGIAAPFSPAAALKAVKAGKAMAPRAGALLERAAAKGQPMPLEMNVVPEGGPKLSKEEYAAMMREKYASQNVAKEAKKAVTFADIAPKEVKVPADDLGLYSPAEKAAANLKRNIGTGEAFLSDIKKAPDVTAEELKLSGVEDWLKSKKTASRQEVQDYMAENRPKLEESEYQQGVGDQDELKFGEGRVIDDDEYINSRADDMAYDWDHYGWTSRDEIREEILSSEDPERAQYLVESGQIDDLVNDHVYDLARQDAHAEYYENPYREFSNNLGYRIFGNDDVGYSIQNPNGEDITPSRGAYDIETAEGAAREHAINYGIVNEGETKFHDYQLEGGDNYREILIKAPGTKGEAYESSHWDEPNVVAHLRLQDRVDAEGKKVLYVDEMQSDWHQEGAEHGYKGPDHEAQIKENRNAIANLRNQAEYLRAEKEDLITKLHEKHRDLGHVQILQLDEVKKYDSDLLALKKQQDALSDRYANLTKAVPEGPYKDNWHELALKRVMNYAAKNGYERVAFSSSKPQVERWGTESIAFEKSEMGDTPAWKVAATEQRGGRAGHVDLEAEARARGILQEKEPQIIETKDDLRKVISSIGRRWTNEKIDRLTNKTWKRMQEESVGVVEPRREGMEEFYDRTLGNSINKYAKKYKGKAGDTKVFEGEYNSATGKHYARGYEATGHPARYIDITPEMQNSLLKGQPMKRGGIVRMAAGGSPDPYQDDEDMSLDEKKFALLKEQQKKAVIKPMTASPTSLNELRQSLGLPDQDIEYRDTGLGGALQLNTYSKERAKEMFPKQYGIDDQRDAARHMIAAGTLARKLSPSVARFVGKGYEFLSSPATAIGYGLGLNEMPPDYAMDIYNNELGIELARKAKTQEEFERLVNMSATGALPEKSPGRAMIIPTKKK